MITLIGVKVKGEDNLYKVVRTADTRFNVGETVLCKDVTLEYSSGMECYLLNSDKTIVVKIDQ